MTTYNILIKSPAERELIIQRAIESSTKSEDFYYFRGTKTPLPLIRISIDVPIYRLANFRTFTDQREFIAKENVEVDLFKKGQEKESVQLIQHNILSRLAKKGKEGSIVPVIDVLRKEKQREPLLITSFGVMVNGNRRLAAMRELYNENSSDATNFSHVDLMVLPKDATESEIIDIEASLQGQRETKLDYDWIGDAQLVKSQVQLHKSTMNVAERLNRSEKDIKNTLLALAEADLYLKEWVKSEGEYNKVKEDAEQFFKDLPKSLDGKSNQLGNASRYIAWSLFENRAKLPSRIYAFNSAFGNLAEDVLDRFANNMGISTEDVTDDSNKEEYEISIELEESEPTYEKIIEIIKDQSNEDAVKSLINASIDAIESAKGQKSGEAALIAINQAHSKLKSVDITKANANTYKAIQKQLESIVNISNKLSDSLLKITGGIEKTN